MVIKVAPRWPPTTPQITGKRCVNHIHDHLDSL